jgi:pilus assembly protein TadC
VVSLLGAVLRSGASAETGLVTVCAALPGHATDRLGGLRARLAMGAAPGTVWSALAADPVLAPLGRCLARAHESGAPVAESVERLAVELSRSNRADTEDRARAVGVRAAVPLGLCLLPSFLLLGIVPVIGSLMTTILG